MFFKIIVRFIFVFIGFSMFLDSNAQIKREFEIKVTDSGLYFDGEKRSSGDLNSNGAGFDYFFGRRITPHGDCIEVYKGHIFVTWYRGGMDDRHLMLSRSAVGSGSWQRNLQQAIGNATFVVDVVVFCLISVWTVEND